MKTTSILFRALSACFVLILCTQSLVPTASAFPAGAVSRCGEWKVDDQNGLNDQRMTAGLRESNDESCDGSFLVTNNTGLRYGDYLLGGSYTLQLRSIQDNATVDIETYLVPGLRNEILTTPVDPGRKALVTIKGEMTWDTYAIDLGIFASNLLFDYVKLPCELPADYMLLAAISASSEFNQTAAYLRDRDFKNSINEFEESLDVFYEKFDITLKDFMIDAGIECLFDDELIKKIVGNNVIKGKIVLQYAARIPVIIIDLFKYQATSASVAFAYTPSPSEALPVKKWIAFLNKNDIWLVHPDGSGLKQITENGENGPRVDTYKWSPDGKLLAYSLRSDTGSAIFIYDVETLTSQLIIKDDVGGGFDWSLNGKQILYETPFGPQDIFSNKGLWVFSLETGKSRQTVRKPSMNPQWSPEGGYILYSIPGFEPAGYNVADYDTGRIVTLPLNPNGGMGAGNCQWSPEDLLIACITVSDGSPAEAEMRFMNENGTILETLSLPERIEGSSWLFWSPDREKLAISHYEDSKAETEILTLRTQEYTYLASGVVSDWSSDGNWILAWESGISMAPAISIVNTGSGQIHPIGEGMSPVLQP